MVRFSQLNTGDVFVYKGAIYIKINLNQASYASQQNWEKHIVNFRPCQKVEKK